MRIENRKLIAAIIASCEEVDDLEVYNSQLSIVILQSPFRRGVSLLEVLISAFVLAIGMLGLAALLPVGKLAMVETMKADRTGDCGRAGLRDVKVRRMLDSNFWVPNTTVGGVPTTDVGLGSFVIDPLGITTGAKDKFGAAMPSGGLPRISLMPINLIDPTVKIPYTLKMAQEVFTWQDDLQYDMPEDMNPPLPVGRPNLVPGQYQPRYSWFVTVTPAAGEVKLNPSLRARYVVSIVICYGRAQEQITEASLVDDVCVEVTDFADKLTDKTTGITTAPGGGGITLAEPITNPVNGKTLKENNWIALVSPAVDGRPPICCWYRVVSVGDPTTNLSLAGPDWLLPKSSSRTMTWAVMPAADVIGVYTSVVEVDRNPLWLK